MNTTTAVPAKRLQSTVLGYPRIGPNRELKRALEAHWSGRLDADGLEAAAASVRAGMLDDLAVLDTVPTGTFSLYDHVLDTVVAVDALASRHRRETALASYFAAARGDDAAVPLEMTKWFDTNYHYLVPEIGPGTAFNAKPDKAIAEFLEARERGLDARPVLLGPVSFLLLAKPDADAPADFRPLDRLGDLVEVYVEILTALGRAGAGLVQLDEPALCADRTPEELASVGAAYRRLVGAAALVVAGGYGPFGEALPVLLDAGAEGVALDLVRGRSDLEVIEALDVSRETSLFAGVVDGRNIWRADLAEAAADIERLQRISDRVGVASSSSLLHVPVDLDAETDLPAALTERLAFARQKLREITALADPDGPREARPAAPGAWRDEAVRARLDALEPDADRRVPYAERRAAQAGRVPLPLLPTTTIGSFPQTAELRNARAAHRRGLMIDADYGARMRAEVAAVIAEQERLGLDVLVHGEPERNDMVQYFAEQLTGFATTAAGWVQSYGSRCVRPPVLFGDVARTGPMTVEWTSYAQSLTEKPVKGMLTGPVTILAWSFVRDDQPLADTADQVALALREEVADLEAAGTAIIQVDEPALRELLPVRGAARGAYRDWATRAFRLVTAGVGPATAIHTHLCYSEFGEVIDAIAALDADVTSIEASRSKMEVLADLDRARYRSAVGPGVWDIHSPRVPAVGDMAEALRLAVAALGPERVWVNPDCGLKTRRYEEVRPSLANLVAAAGLVREQLV
ncbi:5-methyltetrahydropteroyltriglutamate--homocysteine S-methyltransferase [Glycomyces sp. TRM65418]|uniref:5-methyltetrahydropteroyltriglutamate-- homocysteine S-methyltransferase n=1 Tax=Glycomyces sp. TRM65418 TaxID=2867006 RepID=UPI001CE5652B|nr:5-methyltetrahydropteroyltriglutamate--homocysteine S-methyltransferase [Glycomyces sp. TRM65418]MCC3764167.1 5-methyltetrahydropteroyltriglutamate--homocysteine S-methyltransferase [Glycomyces sp. TRM65418]QZD53852.1 5-methyltetrahydropteroyltriglutamate--homocysteine S-methyltransferase [Glycomyces sp. TRM65418]